MELPILLPATFKLQEWDLLEAIGDGKDSLKELILVLRPELAGDDYRIEIER